MNKRAAHKCYSQARLLCREKGFEFDKRVYRAVKRYYNDLPHFEKANFGV